MELDSKCPTGPVETRWDRHRFNLKLVNPANKLKYTVIVVGTGLAGGDFRAPGKRRSAQGRLQPGGLPRDGDPAQAAGLFPGDFLLAVDGRSTLNARLATVVPTLRGPAGSNVVLRVFDPDRRESSDVPLARRAPLTAALDGLVDLGHGVLYARIPEFTPAVVERLRAVLGAKDVGLVGEQHAVDVRTVDLRQL